MNAFSLSNVQSPLNLGFRSRPEDRIRATTIVRCPAASRRSGGKYMFPIISGGGGRGGDGYGGGNWKISGSGGGNNEGENKNNNKKKTPYSITISVGRIVMFLRRALPYLFAIGTAVYCIKAGRKKLEAKWSKEEKIITELIATLERKLAESDAKKIKGRRVATKW